MKYFITILTLLSITNLTYSQDYSYVDKLSNTNYTEWNGQVGHTSIEKPVRAVIEYQGNYNFIFNLVLSLETKDKGFFTLPFKATHSTAFDGESGTVILKLKDFGSPALFIKIQIPNKHGFQCIVHYLYIKSFINDVPLRIVIKDQKIIDIIDTLTSSINKQEYYGI